MNTTLGLLTQALDLGGPVVLVLMGLSVIAMTTAIFKIWHFARAGVGRHHDLKDTLEAWDTGDVQKAVFLAAHSKSYLASVIDMSFGATAKDVSRIAAEAETRFAKLETGLRLLDSIAQVSPLLGLFGTVLGMIEAFQALQEAGTQVDPSLLAGGIWVALLTTAVGLAVAMPTSLVHSWLEGRMDADRVLAEHAVATVLFPRDRQNRTMGPEERLSHV